MPLDKASNSVLLTFIQFYLKVLVKGLSLKPKSVYNNENDNNKDLIGCSSIKSVKSEGNNLEWYIQIHIRFSCKCESY